MDKSIKDYLHLYLGVKCNVEGIEKYGWYRLSPTVLESAEKGDITVKPMLRPLSSMTEEEAIQIAHIVQINACGTDIITVDKTNEKQWVIWNSTDYEDVEDAENNGAMILIDFTFPFGIYKGSDSGDFFPTPDFTDIAEVTIYLLSRGFDLFNLVERGLAIDSTLKPV